VNLPRNAAAEHLPATGKFELDRSARFQVKATARLGSWSLNPVTGAMVWSAEMCRILEIEPDHAPRTQGQFLDFVHPDDRHSFALVLMRSIQEQQDGVVELRLLLASGEQRYAEQHWHLDLGVDGNAARVVGTFQDITERRLIEDEVRRQRTQLSLAARLGKIGAWRLDISPAALWWSDEVCAIHEVPPGTAPTLEDAIGFYLPHCREAIRAACAACIDHGVPFDLESEISTGKNQRRWVRAIGEAVRDANDSTLAIQGAFQDITDSKLSEEKSARLEARLISTFESLDMGFFAVDPQWRITYINGYMERCAGIARDKLLGAPLWTSIPGLRNTPFEALLQAAMSGRTSVSTEAFFAPFSAWCVANAHGSGEVLAVYVRDISEERRAQEQIAQASASLEARVKVRTAELELARRDAELASSAKTVFLTTMSHEIRTPMNGVIGLVDILSRTQLLPDQIEIVDLLKASAKSLLTIIDNILDFSKIEASRMQLELRPTRVGHVVEQVCAILNPSAASKDVDVFVFVDPLMPEPLMCDETRLNQVLVNLIGNAIKFTAGGAKTGQVWVRATCISASQMDATISFEISDNGVGMDSTTVESLFTAFQQGDVSTTRKFGGTGLGLAITHSLVAMMGGHIEVRSAPGIGSVFQVQLTLARAEPAPSDLSDEQPLRGITCEIAGTLGSLAQDMAAYLSHAGASVVSAPPKSGDRHVVVSLAGQTLRSFENAAGRQDEGARSRFVLLGAGKPATPALADDGCVEMDVRAMSRTNLLRAVKLALDPRLKPRRTRRVQNTNLRPQRAGVILVAEDNAMNRQVIARQLRLLSYASDYANDGRQAFEMWRLHDYAALLCDLRMPEMDGYALTAAIRAAESKGRRLPIIALTANALPEEARHCLAAGMDDYLVKPVVLEVLGKALEKWVHADAPVSPLPVAPVDLGALRSIIGDDEAETARMVKLFRSSSRKLRIELQEAAKRGDTSEASSAAHRLKSNAYSIGAKGLGDLCERIERLEHTAADAGFADLLRTMEAEAVRVEHFLEALPSGREKKLPS
jgi:PAS domain S-box-containing protein